MRKLFFLCWMILPLSLLAQLSPEQALKTLDEKFAQEKLHIFTDREEYASGETIFFKAYLFSGYVKSFISSTVYVELYTDQGELISRRTVPLWKAVGNGSITLPESLPEGMYHIRAYTKWMLNFDPSFQYYSTVLVYNSSSEKKIAKTPVKWTAAAYPESGLLLAGEENKVAIRLTAIGSLPSSWRGTLVNAGRPNHPILKFNSLTPDVAAFLFTPEADNMYEVHITDSFGNFSSVVLTPASSGVLLRAEQAGKEVYVDMFFKGLPESGLNYKLVAHMQQQPVVVSVIRKKQAVVKTSIPIEKLMTGILHLTLFDPQGEPVAERLVFVDPEATERKPVEVKVAEPAGMVWQTDSSNYFNYAVSVTAEAASTVRKTNIFSDLWFGDIQRMPENSAVYFVGRAEDGHSIDALLITEKWKRFRWNDVLSNKFPVIKDGAERYFSYRGTATRNKKGIANELLTLMLSFPDSSLQFLQVKTDEFGEFHLDDIVFYDSVKVYYQPAKGKRTNDVGIVFERKNSGHAGGPLYFPRNSYQLISRSANDTVSRIVLNAKEQLQAEKTAENKYLEMEAVTVSAERKTKKELLNEELTSPLFQTQNEVILDIMNDEPSIQSYTNIFDWLDGRVAGLGFKMLNEGDKYINPLTMQPDSAPVGTRVPMMRDQQVSLFIDENPTDLNAVLSLPTSEIAMVKIIKGYFAGATGGGTGGGAIAIYTRKAGLNKENRNSLPSGVMYGYSSSKVFSNLNNSVKQNLINWSPLLIPNEEGNISIDLPCVPGGSRVTLTGFTTAAQPVYKVYIYPGK